MVDQQTLPKGLHCYTSKRETGEAGGKKRKALSTVSLLHHHKLPLVVLHLQQPESE